MKKKLLLVISLLIVSISYAQIPGNIEVNEFDNSKKLFWGCKTGLTFPQLSVNGINKDGHPSIHFGLFVKYRIKKRLFFQPELLFTKKGSKGSSKADNNPELYSECELSYLEFKFSLVDQNLIKNDKFFLIIGQSLGILLNANYKDENGEWEEMKHINPIDSSTYLGGGVYLGKFIIQADYEFFSINISDDWENTRIFNFAGYIGFGYTF